MTHANTPSTEKADTDEINIEEIMREIRQKILAKKEAVGSGKRTPIPVSGERLPPAFYDHLYQAGLVYDEIDVQLYVTKTNIPLIGPVLDKLRYKVHELVLFYVNRLAAEQMHFNEQILHAVSLLAQEIEAEDEQSGDAQ